MKPLCGFPRPKQKFMQLPVHRIEISNPFFEGRNSVYLLNADPITLIDTGVATDRAFEQLRLGLQEHGVDVADVKRVLLTHKHIDHIGNAWRIQQASDAEVFIHACEIKSLTDVDPSGKRFGELVRKRLDAWGVPGDVHEKLTGNAKNKMPMWKLEACEALELPDSISFASGEELKVIHTPGHTMGSVCFRLGEQLFSGDHVLEHISPNIGGGDMRSRGMLGRFLSSLTRVQLLGDLDMFPGHGEPFRGLQDRCLRLKKHHDIRLRQAQRAIENGKRQVYEVAKALYGNLKDFHVVLGCAEANAHLEYLADKGQIVQEGDQYSPANTRAS